MEKYLWAGVYKSKVENENKIMQKPKTLEDSY